MAGNLRDFAAAVILPATLAVTPASAHRDACTMI
jgi:hypothetical protein